MTTSNHSRSAAVVAIAILPITIGGCLSQEKPDSEPSIGANHNSAPVIHGTPTFGVITGDTYSFTPSASDADGDPLSFTITNKPRWTTFDRTTGSLYGQPTLGDEGNYSNITISVTDGVFTASLPTFSIDVTQSALGSMTLSWIPPTENIDGSPLTDLAGYTFYLGTSRGSFIRQVRVYNPGLTMYVIDNLLPDRYFVVATAFNTNGIESVFSNEAVTSVTEM